MHVRTFVPALRALAVVLAACAAPAAAQRKLAVPGVPFDPSRAQVEIGIDQRLGERLPLDARFRDEAGREVRLGDYFGERPVLLALVYYECRTLCTEVLNGTSRLLRALPLEPGADFEVVAVGIDPTETPEAAASAKRRHAPDVAGSAAGGGGVHFLVGDQAAIDAVAEAAGFRYVYYPDTGEFAHGSAVMVATPDGRLSHYFYGIEYVPKDVRLALVESSRGKLGSLVDQVLLLCFHYDPTTGKYGFAIVGALRAAGILTVVALATYMAVQLARDRRGQGPASAVPATSRGEAS